MEAEDATQEEKKQRANDKLRRERELRGWSQKKVGMEIGVAKEVISCWECGKRETSPYYQEKLCALFGKNAAELGFIEESPITDISQSTMNKTDFSHLPSAIAEGILLALAELGSQPVSRRTAITAIATYLGIATVQHHEDLFSLCSQGIPACQELFFRGATEQLAYILPMYCTQLAAMVAGNSPFRQQSAALASQAYQLAYRLAANREDFDAASSAISKAVFYARYAEDANLQAASLIRQTNCFLHQKQPVYASRSLQQALLLKEASPLLRGRAYAGLAHVQAMQGNQREALAAIALAHEEFPMQPEHDPAFPYTHFSQYDLYVFGEGRTRLLLGQSEEALKSFTYAEQDILEPRVEPLTRVDLNYYLALASVREHDLERSQWYMQEAVVQARELKSRFYYNKLYQLHQEMSLQWKNERRVRELGEYFQAW